jgi:hypothetical protein
LGVAVDFDGCHTGEKIKHVIMKSTGYHSDNIRLSYHNRDIHKPGQGELPEAITIPVYCTLAETDGPIDPANDEKPTVENKKDAKSIIRRVFSKRTKG